MGPMKAHRGEETVPLHRVLRSAGLVGAVRMMWRLLQGRREVVVLGDGQPAVAPDGPLTPGGIRFAPEFTEEWPLWSVGPQPGTAARDRIPLPPDLKLRIDDWASRWNRAMYDHLYEWPDDGALRASFDAEARDLCDEIAEVLGPEWRVEYGGVDA